MSESPQGVDVASGLGGGVTVFEVVASEFVGGTALARACQIITIMVCATAKMALPSLRLPIRRENRRNWAAR